MSYSELYALAERLGEREPQALGLLRRILYELGPEETQHFVEQTHELDAQGGMLTEDGSRRRTLGGTFFYLVKQYLREQGRTEALEALFPRRAKPRKKSPESIASTSPASSVSSGPPILAGRLRPRMRGRTEQPPLANVIPSAGVVEEIKAEVRSLPSQAQVLTTLSRHIGAAFDIYRRSYNSSSGALTLMAYFPHIAKTRYAAGISAAAAELGVPIGISDEPHQGMLIAAAQAALPEELTLGRSIVQRARETIIIQVAEMPDEHTIHTSQSRFTQETGWKLELQQAELLPSTHSYPMNTSDAIQEARRLLPISSGCYAIGAQNDTHTLLLRFAFPAIARSSYASEIMHISQRTGWQVNIHAIPHQDMLMAVAYASLPEGHVIGIPSIHADSQQLILYVSQVPSAERLDQVRQKFHDETGWELLVNLR